MELRCSTWLQLCLAPALNTAGDRSRAAANEGFLLLKQHVVHWSNSAWCRRSASSTSHRRGCGRLQIELGVLPNNVPHAPFIPVVSHVQGIRRRALSHPNFVTMIDVAGCL
jgi:hypothetical protein